MTIERLISIQNVGRFFDSKARGDVTFRRCNLLFAENGRGKTTLCSILRSLQSGDPAYVIGRRTLGSRGDPSIQIRLANDNATFSEGGWSRDCPNIAIFDGIFVSENVFAGDAVDTAQRRNLYRIIVGSEGVGMAHRLGEIDSEITAKNTEIRNARNDVERRIPAGVQFESFLALEADPAIEAKISAKQRELIAAEQTARIQERPSLQKLALPSLPEELESRLAQSIEGLSHDVEQRMAEHIRQHNMDESWISDGRNYETETCPYCAQDLTGSPIVSIYKSYFSQEYDTLKAQVNDLLRQVRTTFGDRPLGEIGRIIERNEDGVEFWKQYCEIEAPSLAALDTFLSAAERLRDAALSLLESKAAAPLEVIELNEAFLGACRDYEALGTDLAIYNDAVDTANGQINVQKEQAQAADRAALHAELNLLAARRVRHDDETAPLVQSYKDRVDEKTSLEDEKTDIRERLDNYTAEVIGSYEQRINWYLDRFNAGFRIGGTAHSYRGRIASTTYQIVINEVPVDLGDPQTPLDQPSFKNTLSAGDRSTLALAFFLAQLEREPNPEQKVVVLDDPFTSQDSFRRNHTAQCIKSCTRMYAQVIVLSHDAGFLQLIWEKLDQSDRKALQLVRVGENNTCIREFDIEDALQPRHLSSVRILQDYYSLNEGAPLNVIQQMRPVLEGHCRRICPGQFENRSLGEIVGEVRSANEEHVLAPIVDDLEEINEYSRRYHHGENSRSSEEPIDEAELGGYVRLTLRQVGALAA